MSSNHSVTSFSTTGSSGQPNMDEPFSPPARNPLSRHKLVSEPQTARM